MYSMVLFIPSCALLYSLAQDSMLTITTDTFVTGSTVAESC